MQIGEFDIDAYLAKPKNGGKAPGVVLIHEAWGLDQNTKSIADRLAAEGYLVLAPELLAGMIPEVPNVSIMRDMTDPIKRDEAQKKLRAAMTPLGAPEF